MFGFVIASTDDIDETELDRYKSVYCGICRDLCKHGGQKARLCLNHDLNFLAILLKSLYEPEETQGSATCVAHPMKKRPYVTDECVDYAADMTTALTYHKCLDDWHDDGNKRAKSYADYLKPHYDEIRVAYPRQCDVIEEGLKRITAIENCVLEHRGEELALASTPQEAGDEAAHIFGVILGEVFVMKEDMWSGLLRKFGYELGRFIYLMDAAVDLQKDEKSGSFNPFAGNGLSVSDLQNVLGYHSNRVANAFERLPLDRDIHLLRSVIYAGMWIQFNRKYKIGEEGKSGNSVVEPCEDEAPASEPASMEEKDAGSAAEEVGSMTVEADSMADEADNMADKADEAPSASTQRTGE